MVEKLTASKKITLLLLFVLAISSFFSVRHWKGNEKWKWIVAMDGRGYYAYLPAVFIFNDHSFSFYEKNETIEGDPANFLNKTENGVVNKYYCGEAMMLTPFFLSAHLLAKVGGFPCNGYSEPYYYGVLIAAIFYFLFGLCFLQKLLLSMGFRQWIGLSVATVYAFGTNLFYYAVYEPSMSHVYSFCAISAFLFFVHRYFQTYQMNTLFIASAIFGLVILLRPINIVILTLVPFISGGINNFKKGIFPFRSKTIYMLISFLIVIVLVSVQLILYKWQTGHFFIWSYKGEVFNFKHPEIINSLFSYQKGFFIYTPLAFISLGGIVIYLFRNRFSFIAVLIPIALFIYIISSWHCWDYGWSYGLRAYIDYYAVFAILLAVVLSEVSRKKFGQYIINIFLIIIIVVSCIQTYQINKRILSYYNMNKEKYWKVFLRTDRNYENIFYK
jgi:hypothetical protein